MHQTEQSSGNSGNILGVFVKHPIPGRVKTRLGKELTPELACQIYEAFLDDTIHLLCDVSCCQKLILGFAGDNSQSESFFEDKVSTLCHSYQLNQSSQNVPPATWSLWEQPQGDLGVRMAAYFQAHLLSGSPKNEASRVMLIGSDSPSLPPPYISNAFEALSDVDIVLGPSVDGGYYLVGMNRDVTEIFTGIDWSMPQVLRQTLDIMHRQNIRYHLLPPWYDVDTLDDLQMLVGHLEGMAKSIPSRIASKATTKLLSSLPIFEAAR